MTGGGKNPQIRDFFVAAQPGGALPSRRMNAFALVIAVAVTAFALSSCCCM
jgi:hypothetical protein